MTATSDATKSVGRTKTAQGKEPEVDHTVNWQGKKDPVLQDLNGNNAERTRLFGGDPHLWGV